MEQLAISMAIFNSYAKLPEGRYHRDIDRYQIDNRCVYDVDSYDNVYTI